jgi:hypothetical protein
LNLKKSLAGALLVPALAFATAAAPALAQTTDAAPPAPQALPSYAAPGDVTIRGVVRSIDGQYSITVRDEKGYLDHVALHEGTIINPRGLTLAPGQSVTILGQPSGNTFAANEIDTPYHYAYAYGPYPYPYGYPYAYYPRFGIGFAYRSPGFGFRGFF